MAHDPSEKPKNGAVVSFPSGCPFPVRSQNQSPAALHSAIMDVIHEQARGMSICMIVGVLDNVKDEVKYPSGE